MGLFDWLKPRRPQHGPTAEGLYGDIGRGARWTGGPDPAGDPELFLPDSASYVFDIVEWRWDEQLWIEVSTHSDDEAAGFGLVIGLSDGTKTDAAESWEHKPGRGPVLVDRQEWTIPRGHPTREIVLVSHGEPTTRVLRKLEQCFGFEPHAHPALPEKSAVFCVLLPLRGIVHPEDGRFTMRMKVVLQEQNGWPYGEFFLNINSVRKQLWVSEKDGDYRGPILTRFSDFSTAT